MRYNSHIADLPSAEAPRFTCRELGVCIAIQGNEWSFIDHEQCPECGGGDSYSLDTDGYKLRCNDCGAEFDVELARRQEDA